MVAVSSCSSCSSEGGAGGDVLDLDLLTRPTRALRRRGPDRYSRDSGLSDVTRRRAEQPEPRPRHKGASVSTELSTSTDDHGKEHEYRTYKIILRRLESLREHLPVSAPRHHRAAQTPSHVEQGVGTHQTPPPLYRPGWLRELFALCRALVCCPQLS